VALAALLACDAGRPVADALAESIEADPLSAADRRLATQITYGVLRHRRLLDWWIDQRARGHLEAPVRQILRLAFFQGVFLDRVPDYAVVSAAVEQAKRVRPRAQGLINAVLRKGFANLPRPADPGVRYSHPDWVVRRWQARWPEHWETVLRASNETPPLTLRLGPHLDPAAVIRDLAARGLEARRSPVLPGAVRVQGSLRLEDWEPFRTGQVAVQDESSQLVGWVLAPRPGDNILDVAAGLGGKTFHLLERAPGAHVTALDQSADRIRRLAAEASRRGLADRVTAVVGDARTLPAPWLGTFHRVLLDAPCSGLGVMRRRVDARWKKREADLPRLQALQVALALSASRALCPGGVLVYSVCSPEPEETVEVVSELTRQDPSLHPEDPKPWLPSPALRDLAGPEGLLIRPGELGLDGFYLMRLRKEGGPDAAHGGGTP
jgi:16S rRNA (cytosine967-C5)-methyltransferase